MSALDPLFRPGSIAVVGVSRRRGAVGRRIFESLVSSGFRGPVFAVNSETDHVGPHPSHRDLTSIGEPVDLVVVAVPADGVEAVVGDAISIGAGGVIVVSAGFAEAGEVERERRLAELVADADVRMIGPNCLGVVNTDPEVRLNASFAPDPPAAGGVALCSQSGALGIAVIDAARRAGVGLSAMVSIGNATDVGVTELLEAWGRDDRVSSILLYLESFEDPRALAETAREIVGEKPIVAVKAGRTEAGSAAAESHTAAVSGAEDAVDALLEEAGILRVGTLDEMLGVARFLEHQPIPTGDRVAIVTNSGGPGILTADAIDSGPLQVTSLSDGLTEEIGGLLPDEASTSNPVDLLASAGPDEYRQVVARLAESGEVDVIVAVYTEIEIADLDAIGRGIARGAASNGVPIVAVVIGGDRTVSSIGEDVPVFATPSDAVAVLDALRRGRERRRIPEAAARTGRVPVDRCREVIADELGGGDGWLGPLASRRLAEVAGLNVVTHVVARSRAEAGEATDDFDRPVAMSVISAGLVHKTEHGGVELDVEGREAAQEAYARIERKMQDQGRSFEGVIVAPMLEGVEVFVGVRREPRFGPLVGFGLGGVLVELLEDVSFRLAPLSEATAREMIEEIEGYPALTGFRDREPADLRALVEALVLTADLACSLPEIAELEMNPVFARPDAALVADVRVRIEDQAGV